MQTTSEARLTRERERKRRWYAARLGRPVRVYARRGAAELEPLGPATLPELPLRLCVGCGLEPVRGPTYCRRCRILLARGMPVSDDPRVKQPRRIR